MRTQSLFSSRIYESSRPLANTGNSFWGKLSVKCIRAPTGRILQSFWLLVLASLLKHWLSSAAPNKARIRQCWWVMHLSTPLLEKMRHLKLRLYWSLGAVIWHWSRLLLVTSGELYGFSVWPKTFPRWIKLPELRCLISYSGREKSYMGRSITWVTYPCRNRSKKVRELLAKLCRMAPSQWSATDPSSAP